MIDPDLYLEGRESLSEQRDEPPAKIIEALRQGDHHAFDYIYLHYSDSLIAFLTNILRSREDAEEIVQNVFIKIWEKRERIDPDKGIRKYLYHLARHYAFDHLDHRKVREKYADYILATENEGAVEGAEELMASKELRLLMDITIQRMPPKQREAFKLSRDEGMTYDQIALRMGISKNTVRNHIATAIKELKKIICLFLLFFI